MPYHTILASGALAAAAWEGYFKNRSNIPTDERVYADTLPVPTGCSLRVVDNMATQVAAEALRLDVSDTSAARTLGYYSCAMISFSDNEQGTHKLLNYVHTRSNMRGAGHASAALTYLQQHLDGHKIVTWAAACRSREASLFLLRHFFHCDIELFSADFARTGERIAATDMPLSFSWSSSDSKTQAITFVESAARKQRARRTIESTAFAEELDVVVAHLKKTLAGNALSAADLPAAPTPVSAASTASLPSSNMCQTRRVCTAPVDAEGAVFSCSAPTGKRRRARAA